MYICFVMRDNTANKNKSLGKVKPQVSHHNLIEGFYIKKEDTMNKKQLKEYNKIIDDFVIATSTNELVDRMGLKYGRTHYWSQSNMPNIDKLKLVARDRNRIDINDKRWAEALDEEDNLRGQVFKSVSRKFFYSMFGGMFGKFSSQEDFEKQVMKNEMFEDEKHLQSFALYLTIGLYIASETRDNIFPMDGFQMDSKPSDREDMELLAKYIYNTPYGTKHHPINFFSGAWKSSVVRGGDWTK